VVFNRPDQNYEAYITRFIAKSLRSNATILSVAAIKEERRPLGLIENRQSFDVVEQLRQRGLAPSQVRTIATVFARQILATLKPTLSVEPMHLFLSHRRLDGEEIAASFYKGLVVATQTVFRDLCDVRVGEDAQHVIDQRLRESDAVLFLDTPKSGESPWIARELSIALSLQLPVVWVRLGPDAGRSALAVRPSGRPHFEFPALDPAIDEVSQEVLETIVHQVFDIHRRDSVDRVLGQIELLQMIADEQGFELRQIDVPRMLFSLRLPRAVSRYRQRPLIHLLQFFGRMPTRKDFDAFPGCAKEVGYGPDPNHGPHYDSAVMLAPIPSQKSAILWDCGVHTDSIDDYLAQFQPITSKGAGRRLVISGAFADCEPDFQQSMSRAVHAFASAALVDGVGVSFGAHPTFQFLIFDLARRLRPHDYVEALRMYVSLFFVTTAAVDEFRDRATVFATPADASGREASLTEMRKAMLNDPEAGALVVIGGKTTRGGHVPGVDEEIRLAREANLPVFIVGSVGGRSSELCATMGSAGLVALNGLAESDNQDLMNSLEYDRLARVVLDSMRK
jgi:hypothetical protein